MRHLCSHILPDRIWIAQYIVVVSLSRYEYAQYKCRKGHDANNMHFSYASSLESHTMNNEQPMNNYMFFFFHFSRAIFSMFGTFDSHWS